MENKKSTPPTLLILLTMFDLVVAGAGAMPALMGAIVVGDHSAHGDVRLLLSVPVAALILLLVAWTLHAKGRSGAARLFALLPLIWALVVFIAGGGAIV